MSLENPAHRLEEDIPELDDSSYVDGFSYSWHELDIPGSDVELHAVLTLETPEQPKIVAVTDVFGNDPEALAEEARLARNLATVETYDPNDRDKRFTPLVEHDRTEQEIEFAASKDT